MQGFNVCRRLTVLVLHKPIAKCDSMATGLCKVCTMLIGYARVSRQDGQDTAVQIEALKKAGGNYSVSRVGNLSGAEKS